MNRQLLLWPVDAEGRIQGEDAYSSGPVRVTKLTFDQLPREHVELEHAN